MSFVRNETTGIWETTKSPFAELDYSVDWTAIHSDETAITASTWVVDPGDGVAPTIDPVYTIVTGFVTTALIAGGTLGGTYTIRNRITLASGLKDERIFKLKIRETSI